MAPRRADGQLGRAVLTLGGGLAGSLAPSLLGPTQLKLGTRDLAFKPRVRWDEHALHADAPRESMERREAVPA